MRYSELCGKNQYTKNELDRVLDNIYKKRKVKLRTYFCPDCHTWHLTKNIGDDDCDFM